MEDSHCFFANDILVHNCQHTSCETAQIISDTLVSCYHKIGISATPVRDEGDDILIDGCFGKTICDVSASDLIRKGYLVKPQIAFVPIRNLKMKKKDSYPTIYRDGIVENMYRNQWIANLAKHLQESKRNILILVKQIRHGQILNDMLPGSVFLNGSCSKKQRIEHLDLMRQGHPQITIATSIFDEGVDCKSLNAMILAGSGKSKTRALQRVGRAIRTYTYPDGTIKKDALIFDLIDYLPYLEDHAKERLKMYQSEPEFEITHLDV